MSDLGTENKYDAREVAPKETDATKPGAAEQWLKALVSKFFGDEPDPAPTADGTHAADGPNSVNTTSNWQNAASVDRDDGDHWTEARPLSENTDAGSGDPHEARLLQATVPGLEPSDAPTGSVGSNPDWEVVDEATGGGEVAANGYWPSLSAGGYEVYTQTLVLQVKYGSSAAAAGTDNTLSADRDK